MKLVCAINKNAFHRSLNRGSQQRRLQESGIYFVPDQKTVHCPANLEEDLFSHEAPEYHYGFSTMWIVKNASTRPVALAWLRRTASGYDEVSAVNSRISPAHHDPSAILPPGDWKALDTFDGHVFHVREIADNGSLGRVLLRHRVGLIPIHNAFGHQLDLYCDPTDPDIEPVVEEVREELVTTERAPEFRRTRAAPLRPCNTLDIGFRNQVGCPLNVYYTGMYNMTGTPRKEGEECSFTPKSCHEKFKFHLGTNSFADDFMWDWDSQTKFEGTYVGHNFVFRLAKNDDIVVDSVTVEPSYVRDCGGDALDFDESKETNYAVTHPKLAINTEEAMHLSGLRKKSHIYDEAEF